MVDWLDTWAKRIKITLDHNDIDADLVWFPILVHLSASSGPYNRDVTCVFDEVGANSKKIAITKGDGTTQLYVEIDHWDYENRKAWLWVSREGWVISATINTDLFLYYDNAQPDNTSFVGDP